jgi:hypothetical protein
MMSWAATGRGANYWIICPPFVPFSTEAVPKLEHRQRHMARPKEPPAGDSLAFASGCGRSSNTKSRLAMRMARDSILEKKSWSVPVRLTFKTSLLLPVIQSWGRIKNNRTPNLILRGDSEGREGIKIASDLPLNHIISRPKNFVSGIDSFDIHD